MAERFLVIKDLHVNVEDSPILKGLNLEVGRGEVHVIMGPNGAGKSTLANVLLGHPKYEVTAGTIEFEGKLLNDLKPDERAKLGLFLSFQYPEEIPGVTMENFLRMAKIAQTGESISITKFNRILREKMDLLAMKPEYASRYVNDGFSGGEKKKSEILQMLVLEPKLAVLDETDSGLDVDAVRVVAQGVKQYRSSENAIVIITHHSRILEYIQPDYVHFLIDGRIAKSGGPELIAEIEQSGFAALQSQSGRA
ncbi:MAG: Fe-S cluster assembly ATPase SufC [Firmicutes bacterium]|nr:Fe-S cluster assembly ATPase SufC [Bacillota bacterium]